MLIVAPVPRVASERRQRLIQCRLRLADRVRRPIAGAQRVDGGEFLSFAAGRRRRQVADRLQHRPVGHRQRVRVQETFAVPSALFTEHTTVAGMPAKVLLPGLPQTGEMHISWMCS